MAREDRGCVRTRQGFPAGRDSGERHRFTDVVPDERIEFAARVHGDLEIQTTVTFAEKDGKTTLAVHQVYSHETDATRGARARWPQTLAQFAEHLRGRASSR